MRTANRFVWIWVALFLSSFYVNATTSLAAPLHELGHIVAARLSRVEIYEVHWAYIIASTRTPLIDYAGVVFEILPVFALWFWSWHRALMGTQAPNWRWKRGMIEPVLLGLYFSAIIDILLDSGDVGSQMDVARIALLVLWSFLALLASVCAIYRISLARWTLRRSQRVFPHRVIDAL